MKHAFYYFIVVLLVAIVVATGCSPAEKPDPSDRTNGTIPDGQDVDETDWLIDSGRFAGKIGNFIAVRISGVPDEIGPREFKLSEELQENFEQYGLKIEPQGFRGLSRTYHLH